jgi:hypothetical protein
MRVKTWSLALLSLGLAGGLAACGSSDDKDTTFMSAPIDIDGDGNIDGVTVDSNGDGTADGVDTNNDGKADKPLPGGGNTGGTASTTGGGSTNGGGPTSGGGGSTNGGSTGIDITPEDAGSNGDPQRDATVVNPNPATVVCGASECTIKDNFACCEQPSGNSWTGMCIGESGCSNSAGTIIPDKAIARCDTKDDCGGLADQYCCFVRNGPPPSPIASGTPYSRQCRTIADCNNNLAIPPGTSRFSCQKDDDCPNGLKCNSESAGDTVGGGTRTGRPWVKICG